MHPYETRYRIAASAFFVASLILIFTIALMLYTHGVSVAAATGLIVSFVGLAISIPLYSYYKARKEEVKRQSQYDVEGLSYLGKENMDMDRREDRMFKR